MPEPSAQDEFRALLDKIYRDTGLDCSRYKENYLKRRIGARMRAVAAESYAAYSRILDSQKEEYAKLKDRITVNVTEFFRDSDVYVYLRETLLPLLLSRAQEEQRPLFLWSAGCSSGEEPYSLAMLLGELGVENYSILATDIDELCLAKAKRGHYDAEAVHKSVHDNVTRWFKFDGEDAQVLDSLKSRVHFERHNLFADPPPGAMDLVLCRNVMIYFSRELQQRLLEAFHSALRPGGYFFPGKTETILGPVRSLYTSISVRARAFQRL